MRNLFSFSHLTSGFMAVLIGFTGSVALIFQAATLMGGTEAQISSWLFALGLSISASCIGLSWYYRMPILAGWSTPGAAFLASSLLHTSMPEAIGAFIFASLLTILTGMTGILTRTIERIPRELTSAMLAGILFHFGSEVFNAMGHEYSIVGGMLITYLLGKRFFPRHAVILTLLVGFSVAKIDGAFHMEQIVFAFSKPVFIVPEFTKATLLGVGIPLFFLTMTSQNIPGIAVLNSLGYHPPFASTLRTTGFFNLLFAPLGCYSICLTAFTAAICASEEADANPRTRYKSTIFAGLCWLVIGLLGTTILSVFMAFPKELLAGIAGIALFGTIAQSLKQALDTDKYREPALITILVAASNLSIWGVGSACWALIAGLLAYMVLNGFKQVQLQVTGAS